MWHIYTCIYIYIYVYTIYIYIYYISLWHVYTSIYVSIHISLSQWYIVSHTIWYIDTRTPQLRRHTNFTTPNTHEHHSDMSIHVSIYTYMSIPYICICMYIIVTCLYMSIHILIHTSTQFWHVYTYTSIHISILISIHTMYVCTFRNMYMCIFSILIRLHTYVYTYIYTCIDTHIRPRGFATTVSGAAPAYNFETTEMRAAHQQVHLTLL